MSNFIFTASAGRYIQYASLSTGSDAVVVLLLKASGLQADTTLRDYTTLSTLLASNTEATFTNYVRKVLTSGFTITQNFTTNVQTVAQANQTWFAAGGASNDGNLGLDRHRVSVVGHAEDLRAERDRFA